MPRPQLVLSAFGSLGDLHPIIALAFELKARGTNPIIATSERYRAKIAALGLGFHPVRPDFAHLEQEPSKIARYMDLKFGTERILRELIPDHAARMERLGIGRQMARSSYDRGRVAAALGALLGVSSYGARARAISARLTAEAGAARGADVVMAKLIGRSTQGLDA